MVVLASASPRRRELLARIVAKFRVVPSAIEETLDAGPYEGAVTALAARKARAVAEQLGAGLVLGADTLVLVDGDALGKPVDAPTAQSMLRRLRGRDHRVVTGVAVVDARSGHTREAVASSRVLMAEYPESLIDAYVASGAPFDKAGGYAIQDLEGALVAGVVGSYTNVVGLPLGLTRRLLEAASASVVTGPGWP
jgi:septum formation protein